MKNTQNYRKTSGMKKIFVLFICSFLSLPSFAQYRLVEGELGLTYPFAIPSMSNQKSINAYPGIHGEIRFNLPQTNFSVGTYIYINGWDIELNNNHKFKNNLYAVLSICDYNFNKFKMIQPFIGFGLGVANLSIDEEDMGKLYVMPRIGVEFWHRLRLSMSYHITDEHFSGFSVSLGFVIGGGKK